MGMHETELGLIGLSRKLADFSLLNWNSFCFRAVRVALQEPVVGEAWW